MGTESSDTEAVVQTHLDAFVRQTGIDALVRDYHDDARFMSEAATYHGKREIRQFFEAFLASLPPNAIDRFSLRSLRVEGEVAYITWSIGDDVPLGTDTFVVRDRRIVSQTFAMHPPAAA
ncbi:MAG TPA: nuclear transport factor 2 family protein [Steroidobacteraceae bacterium]